MKKVTLKKSKTIEVNVKRHRRRIEPRCYICGLRATDKREALPLCPRHASEVDREITRLAADGGKVDVRRVMADMRDRTKNGYNVIVAARESLGLDQEAFGKWLAPRLGRNEPISAEKVADWEEGRRPLRKGVWNVCLPIAVKDLADDIIREVSDVNGVSLGDGDLPPEYSDLRDDIENWILELLL